MYFSIIGENIPEIIVQNKYKSFLVCLIQNVLKNEFSIEMCLLLFYLPYIFTYESENARKTNRNCHWHKNVHRTPFGIGIPTMFLLKSN